MRLTIINTQHSEQSGKIPKLLIPRIETGGTKIEIRYPDRERFGTPFRVM